MSNAERIEEVRAIPGNAVLLDELRTRVGRCCVVPFVGAGVSAPFGYPQWAEFLRGQGTLYGVLDDVNNELAAGRYEEAASVLDDKLRGTFNELVTITFQPTPNIAAGKIGGLPQALTKLTPGPVVTTNYDEVLERAYGQEQCPFDAVARPDDGQMLCEAFSGNRRFLLKIHGHWGEESNRILTLEQYERFYGAGAAGEISQVKALPQALQLMFRGRTVLFLGCSLLEDRYLRMLRRLISDGLRIPMHFAVLEDKGDMEARRLALSGDRIVPIFFPRARFDLIADIVRYAASEVPAAAPVTKAERMALAAFAVAPAAAPTPAVPPELRAAVNDGRCVAFIGAGASFDAGFPSWRRLAHDFILMTVEEGKATPAEVDALRDRVQRGDIFEAVDFCLGRVPERVHRAISVRLDARGLDSPTHDLLASIPFRAVVTSNYDTFAEAERPGSRVVLPDEIAELGEEGAKALLARPDPFPVIKIHGTARKPETILFGAADYGPWYQKHPAYGDFLVELFSVWTLFFYGHSLTDGRILELLESAHRVASTKEPRHYAVLIKSDPLMRREMLDRFGIFVIPADEGLTPQQMQGFLRTLATR